METLIEAIRTAVLSDATDEAKHQGALACRTILTALEATPGEPIATVTVEQSAPAPDVAGIVGALRGLPPEQLLDIAIARLRAALPASATAPPVEPLRFHIVPVHQALRDRGNRGGT